MKAKSKTLLLIDGYVNLLISILLILFPFGIAQLLGVPLPNINFYGYAESSSAAYTTTKGTKDTKG